MQDTIWKRIHTVVMQFVYPAGSLQHVLLERCISIHCFSYDLLLHSLNEEMLVWGNLKRMPVIHNAGIEQLLCVTGYITALTFWGTLTKVKWSFSSP
jgi:hypothetical protein